MAKANVAYAPWPEHESCVETLNLIDCIIKFKNKSKTQFPIIVPWSTKAVWLTGGDRKHPTLQGAWLCRVEVEGAGAAAGGKPYPFCTFPCHPYPGQD